MFKFVWIWIEAHTDLFLMCVLKMLEMGNPGGLRVKDTDHVITTPQLRSTRCSLFQFNPHLSLSLRSFPVSSPLSPNGSERHKIQKNSKHLCRVSHGQPRGNGKWRLETILLRSVALSISLSQWQSRARSGPEEMAAMTDKAPSWG